MRQIVALCFFFVSSCAFAGSQACSQWVYELRCPETNRESFRGALEKIGHELALDALEKLPKKEVVVQTMTGVEATHYLVDEEPVLVTILRAGLPLHQGVHRVFPNADVGFLGMSRNEESLEASTHYVALPDLKGKTVIVSDTMVATGGSLLQAIGLIEQREPARIFVIAAIASEAGIERIAKHNPAIEVLAAAIDPSLNDKGYIIPGLGDAGDRSYGLKH